MSDLQQLIKDFFTANEPFFSGLGNFLVVLGILVGVLGTVLGWWKRFLQWVRARTHKVTAKSTDFPFEVMEDSQQLLARLLPDLGQQTLLDREIGYIKGRAPDLDEKFSKNGRVLIRGTSKAGKTREMAELINRQWRRGASVLVLRRGARLDPPYVDPESITSRSLVLVIDDVDQYCGADRQLAVQEDTDRPQHLDPFPSRLKRAIEFFEQVGGASSEVAVVATVRKEAIFWNAIGFDPAAPKPPWNDFVICDLDDLPRMTAEVLIEQLAALTRIAMTKEAKEKMARINGGTFLPVIWQFRDWQAEGKTVIEEAEVADFEGTLSKMWEKRYRNAVEVDATNRFIYGALDIIRRMDLIPNRVLVAELATRLRGTTSARLSRVVRLQTRRSYEQLRGVALRSTILRNLADRSPWLTRWFARLESSSTGEFISRLLYYQAPKQDAGGGKRIKRALQQLAETEFPTQEDLIIPYDGQVDGRGEEWLSSEVATSLLAERASDDRHLVYTLISVADTLIEDSNREAALRLLNRAVEIAPNYAFARRERAWLYRLEKQYDRALSDIDKWQELDPTDYLVHAHRSLVFKDREEYDQAHLTIDRAIEMNPAQAGLYARKANIFLAEDRYERAHELLDKSIALNPKRFWTYGDKSIAFRLEEKLEDSLVWVDKGLSLKADNSWLLGLRGITLRQMERYDEALVAFDQGITLAPKADWIYVHKGITLREMGQNEAALEWIDKGIAIDPKDSWSHRERGDTLRQMERYEEALAAFDAAATLEPKAGWPLAHRGVTLREMQRYDEALAVFDQGITLDPKADWIYVHKGITLREMGQNEAALEWIDKGLEIDPKDSWSHQQRAYTLRAMERHEDALAAFATAATLEPKAAWLLAERGITLRQMERYEDALAAFDQGITLDPKADWIYIHKGITLREMEQNEAALEWIDKGIAIDPKDSWSHRQRSATLRQMQRYEEALAASDAAAKLEPEAGGPLADKGRTLRQMERYDEALTAFDQGISLAPMADWIYVEKGITLREMGQNEAALEWIDKGIAIDPKDSWSHHQKGITLRQMERYEEALAAFDKAAGLEPKAAWPLGHKGITLRELGRYDEALACLDSAVELMSEEAWFLYQRGIVHQLLSLPANAQDDVLNAIRFEEQALEKSPESPVLQFNIALYHLALLDDQRSEAIYRQVLDRQPSRSQLKDAVEDIDSFQRSFPEHEHAKVVRNMLDRRLADLESTGETLVGETVG